MAHLSLFRSQMFPNLPKLSGRLGMVLDTLTVGIPYWVFLNGRALGLMRGKEANIQLPEGSYDIGIWMVFQLWKWQLRIGSEKSITITEDYPQRIFITDKERWWNLLFDIDLFLWLASFFFTLPQPWNTIYDILSEGFFVLWLLRIWIIRKNYFILKPIS